MIRNVFGALLGVAAAVSVGAAEVVWTGSGGDGLWSTPGNWQGGAVPGAADTAVVASSDALTIDESVLAPLATLRKTGAGELTLHDSLLYWPTTIEVSAGTLKVGTRTTVAASARFWPGTVTKTAPGTLLWRNTRLADVKWISGRASGGYFTPRQVMQPWFWSNDGETASAQFQLWNGANTMTDTLQLTQVGDDVYAYITYACYTGANILGADMHAGYTSSYNSVPNNYNLQDIQPFFDLPDGNVRFTDAQAQDGGSGAGVLVWRNIKLKDVVGAVGAGGGNNLGGIAKFPCYFLSNNGTTATAEFRAFYSAGKGTYGVFVVFTQVGDDVYARAVNGSYKGSSANVVNDRMFTDSGAVAPGYSGATATRYNVKNIRPVMAFSPDVRGTITVADGARFDVALDQGGKAAPDQMEMTHAKTVRVCGAGPDGAGALYNSNPSSAWGATFGHVVLTGDTTVGGGAIDIRPMDPSGFAVQSGEAVLEGAAYTLRTRCARFGLVSATVDVKGIVATNTLVIGYVLKGTMADGVRMEPGSTLQLAGTTMSATIPLAFSAGEKPVDVMALDAACNVAGAVNVPVGAAVNLAAQKNIALSGDVALGGTVTKTGDGVLVLEGTLSGSGTLSGGNVRFGGTANRWVVRADDAGFTEKVDVSGVTDESFAAGLKNVEVTYTGLTMGKMFVLAPAGTMTAEQVSAIGLSVVNYTGGVIAGCRLALKDGAIVLMLGDSTIPRTAWWTGRGTPNDFADPANWACTNDFGQAVAGATPTFESTVYVNGGAFDVPEEASLFPCKALHLHAVLAGDCDWSGLDFSRVTSGTLDLAGHDLALTLSAVTTNAFTFTDTSTTGGTLSLTVPEGVTVTNEKIAFTGSLAFVKRGAGTYVSKVSNSYTGGTTVGEGQYWLHNIGDNVTTWSIPAVLHFGATNTPVTVEAGASLDLRGNQGMMYYPVILNGGTFANTGFRNTGTTSPGIGALTLTADSTWHQNQHAVFYGGGHIVAKMNNHTLTMKIDSGVNYAYINDYEFDSGVVDVITGGGFAPCGAGIVTTNALLRMNAVLVPWEHSRIGDMVMRCRVNSAGGSAGSTLDIFGTYTPESDYLLHQVMQKGSAIDLAARELPWSIESSIIKGETLRFAEGARVLLKLGDRKLQTGDQVLAWTKKPEPMPQFICDKPQKGGKFYADDEGLFYRAPMMWILLR